MSNVIAFPQREKDPWNLEEYEAIFGNTQVTSYQRVEAAHQALISYCGYDPVEGDRYSIDLAASDLLIDLLHLVDYHGIDLKTFVRGSVRTFKKEMMGES